LQLRQAVEIIECNRDAGSANRLPSMFFVVNKVLLALFKYSPL
jgi:hypothetical protein